MFVRFNPAFFWGKTVAFVPHRYRRSPCCLEGITMDHPGYLGSLDPWEVGWNHQLANKNEETFNKPLRRKLIFLIRLIQIPSLISVKSFRDGGVVGVGVVSTKSRVAIPSMNLHSCKPPLPRLNSRYLRVITRMIFFTQRISVLDHSEVSCVYGLKLCFVPSISCSCLETGFLFIRVGMNLRSLLGKQETPEFRHSLV